METKRGHSGSVSRVSPSWTLKDNQGLSSHDDLSGLARQGHMDITDFMDIRTGSNVLFSDNLIRMSSGHSIRHVLLNVIQRHSRGALQAFACISKTPNGHTIRDVLVWTELNIIIMGLQDIHPSGRYI